MWIMKNTATISLTEGDKAVLNHVMVEFRTGKLLHKEMLQEIEHRTVQQELFYSGYADGILWGMELSEEDEQIWLGVGAVKKDGAIYYLEEPVNLQQRIQESGLEDGLRCAVVLEKRETLEVSESVFCSGYEVVVKAVRDLSRSDLCICTYQSAGRLARQLHGSGDAVECLREQTKEAGLVLSLAEQEYALPGETTFPPAIFDLIRKSVEQKEQKTLLDRILLMQLYSARAVSQRVLLQYLEGYETGCDAKDRISILKGILKTLEINRPAGQEESFRQVGERTVETGRKLSRTH